MLPKVQLTPRHAHQYAPAQSQQGQSSLRSTCKFKIMSRVQGATSLHLDVVAADACGHKKTASLQDGALFLHKSNLIPD